MSESSENFRDPGHSNIDKHAKLCSLKGMETFDIEMYEKEKKIDHPFKFYSLKI